MTLGTLEVYTLQDASWQHGDGIDNYYWRDAASPQGYGPFNTLYHAIEHYKWLLLTCKSTPNLLNPAEQKTAPVIRVDFQRKSRVESEF